MNSESQYNASSNLEPTSQLRLLILDYPKLVLNDEKASKVFSDLLRYRQINFERTSEQLVYVDKLDLIGTHYLIYDTSDLFNPKIVAGIRTSYTERCNFHSQQIPLEAMIANAKPETQSLYASFKDRHKNLVECNGWFTNPEFSSSKIGRHIPDILFFALTTFLERQGIFHFIGATNERFKGSRHVARVGKFKDGHFLYNPLVPDKHKLTLVEEYNKDWQQDCLAKFHNLMVQRIELAPPSISLRSYDEIYRKILTDNQSAA